MVALRRDEIFLRQAFSDGLERLSQRVFEVARAEQSWIEKICAGLLASLEFLDEEPNLARQLVLDDDLSQVGAQECTARLETALGAILELARKQVIVGCELMPSAALLAELAVGGALSLMRAHMRSNRPLPELVPALMVNVVEPYLGRGAAQADLAGEPRAVGRASTHAEVAPIRITPDNLRVLSAIADSPRLSSVQLRGIAGLTSMDRAREIVRRLRQRGLIEKSCATRAREPSTWLLTPYGRRILELVEPRLERAA